MHIISDELYNEILNTEFPSELLEIKNSIINSNNENQEDTSNKNSILIRVLSQNEFDNFIKNNTLDGAIAKSDINAWHYHETAKRLYVNAGYYDNNGVISYLSEVESQFKNASLVEQITMQTINSRDYSYKYLPIYSEITTNNTNNTNIIYNLSNHRQCVATVWWAQYYGDRKSITYATVQNNISISKTVTSLNSNCVETSTYCHGNYGDFWCYTRFYYTFMPSFRPVFQYIDNKKPQNIYS